MMAVLNAVIFTQIIILNGFPVGKDYKTHTLNDALSTKKLKVTAKPVSKPVVVTTSKIETMDSDEDISAAAVILPDSPAQYGSNLDKDWEMSDCEVRALICVKHLLWKSTV